MAYRNPALYTPVHCWSLRTYFLGANKGSHNLAEKGQKCTNTGNTHDQYAGEIIIVSCLWAVIRSCLGGEGPRLGVTWLQAQSSLLISIFGMFVPSMESPSFIPTTSSPWLICTYLLGGVAQKEKEGKLPNSFKNAIITMPNLKEDCTQTRRKLQSSLTYGYQGKYPKKILAEFSSTLKEYSTIKWDLFWDITFSILVNWSEDG